MVGKLGWTGEVGREKCRDRATYATWRLLPWERERSRLQYTFCGPSNSNSVTEAETLGQRVNIEGLPLWSNNPHCQASNKAMEPGHLPNPPRVCLPHILPMLAAGPRKNSSSVELKSRIFTVLKTRKAVPEWQMHTDKGGVISCDLAVAITHRTKKQTYLLPLSAYPYPSFPANPSGDNQGCWGAQLYMWL